MIEYVKILKESAYSDFRMAIARSSSQIDSAYLVFDIEENKKRKSEVICRDKKINRLKK